MSKPKHTPGPWIVSSYRTTGLTGPQNTYSIAAAPELLDLLERAIREVEWSKKQIDLKPRVPGCDTLTTFIQAAKAAVRKATGGAE